jgi:hypothetical protein
MPAFIAFETASIPKSGEQNRHDAATVADGDQEVAALHHGI